MCAEPPRHDSGNRGKQPIAGLAPRDDYFWFHVPLDIEAESVPHG